MEIEAKFQIADEATFAELLRLQSLGPFQLLPADAPENQRNVYFDTADGRLRASRHGLRVREIGDRRIATLKGEATVQDGVHERDEWEVDIGDDDRPESWPAGEVRDRVMRLLDGASLHSILTIGTLRRHVFAERDGGRVAELSLDEGTIDARGREQRFRELEIELLDGGKRADFDELVTLLRARFDLQPEERSKLARGLALLDQET